MIEFRKLLHPSYFYPRSPCGERRDQGASNQTAQQISIHALLAESDIFASLTVPNHRLFLSTLSLRRATNDAINGCNPDFISIHALLAESDKDSLTDDVSTGGFLSTLSLRRATRQTYQLNEKQAFLSTLSLRRATLKPPIKAHRQKHFYPRSPCGERPRKNQFSASRIGISIHALLAESDPAEHHANSQQEKFLSTLSLRRATARPTASNGATKFLSTLSLRRATVAQGAASWHKMNFYPRSPCGERLASAGRL